MVERRLQFIKHGLMHNAISDDKIKSFLKKMDDNGYDYDAIKADVANKDSSFLLKFCRDELISNQLFDILLQTINNIEKSVNIEIPQLKKVEDRTQCTVFGFIRECELSFSNMLIPPLISYICLSYYYIPIEPLKLSNNDSIYDLLEEGYRYSWDTDSMLVAKSQDLSCESKIFYKKQKKKRCVIM